MARRRVEVDLILNARNYLTEGRQVRAATEATERAIDDLGDKADGTSRDMEELAANSDLAKHAIGDVGDRSVRAGRGLETFERHLDQTRHSANALTRDLVALDAAMVPIIPGRPGGGGGSDGAALTVPEQLLPRTGGPAARAAGSGFGRTPFTPLLVGGLVAAVIAAAPTIGAILGGAVAGATGTAAMAAGIAAASRDARVRAAASDVAETIWGEIDRAGAGFIDPTIKGLHTIDSALVAMHVPEALIKMAPLVDVIARGFAALGLNFMPGFNAALDRMGPFANVAGHGLADMGDALGDFLDDVTSSKGSIEGLASLFALLNGTIRLLGGTIHWLSDRYRDQIKMSRILLAEAEGLALAVGNTGLAAYFHELGLQIDQMTLNMDDAGDSQLQFVSHLDVTTLAIKRQQAQIESILDTYKKWFGLAMGLDEAQLHVKQGLLDLKETLKENGRHWEDNTQKGLANRQALLDQIQRLNDLRQAEIDAGHDAKQANAQYDAQVEALLNLAGQAGATKQLLDKLRGEYEIKFVVAGLVGVVGAAARLADLAGSGMKAIFGGHRAGGGPVQPGRTYQVGERGPEWLTMGATGGWVTPGGWQSAPATPAGLPTLNLTVKLVDSVTGRVTRETLVTDALNRGVPQATVSAAYP